MPVAIPPRHLREPLAKAPVFLAHLQACSRGASRCRSSVRKELQAIIARCEFGCAYQGPLVNQPVRKGSGRAFAGFFVGQSMAAAERACVQSKRRWKRTTATRATCEGLAPSVGVPLRVSLGAPRGPVHEIRATYPFGTDHPLPIFDLFVQLMVGRYGEPSHTYRNSVTWRGANWTDRPPHAPRQGELRVVAFDGAVWVVFLTPP